MRTWKTIKSKGTTPVTSSKSCSFISIASMQLSFIQSLEFAFVFHSEIIDNKYIILKKLGWGHFSTVWLALKLQDKQLYALKIQKSADKYTESAMEEEDILFEVANNYQNKEWESSVRHYLRNAELEVGRMHTHNLQMYD